MPSKEFLKGKQQVTLYPTEKQHKEIWEKARALNMGLAEYIMFCALNAEIKVIVKGEDVK
jgi:hypothetical protein